MQGLLCAEYSPRAETDVSTMYRNRNFSTSFTLPTAAGTPFPGWCHGCQRCCTLAKELSGFCLPPGNPRCCRSRDPPCRRKGHLGWLWDLSKSPNPVHLHSPSWLITRVETAQQRTKLQTSALMAAYFLGKFWTMGTCWKQELVINQLVLDTLLSPHTKILGWYFGGTHNVLNVIHSFQRSNCRVTLHSIWCHSGYTGLFTTWAQVI